jgi:hypothetical protein
MPIKKMFAYRKIMFAVMIERGVRLWPPPKKDIGRLVGKLSTRMDGFGSIQSTEVVLILCSRNPTTWTLPKGLGSRILLLVCWMCSRSGFGLAFFWFLSFVLPSTGRSNPAVVVPRYPTLRGKWNILPW